MLTGWSRSITVITWRHVTRPHVLLVLMVWGLTPSLPRCHLKATNKTGKSESILCLLFGTGMSVEGFSSKRIALKIDVIGPENILFAGASVHLSAGKFYRLGQ